MHRFDIRGANPDARFCWRAKNIIPDMCCRQHTLNVYNKFVMFTLINYIIEYYSDEVEAEILSLPETLQARYIRYTEKMRIYGANLGSPHTEAFGDGVFEIRLKGSEGIGRVFYCTLKGKRIIMLHSFVKKTQKTPPAELRKAETRMKEVKHDW